MSRHRFGVATWSGLPGVVTQPWCHDKDGHVGA